jgi:hypothetical protein
MRPPGDRTPPAVYRTLDVPRQRESLPKSVPVVEVKTGDRRFTPAGFLAVAIRQGTISAGYWSILATLSTNCHQIRQSNHFLVRGVRPKWYLWEKCHDDQDGRGSVGDPISPG